MAESDFLPDYGFEPPYFEDRQLASMKIPPYSIQAEQSVLGGLMLDNETWDKVADRLGEDDFYRHDHRLIFRAISMLAEKQLPFDVITLAEVLEKNNWLAEAGGLSYLGAMAKDTPSAANIVAYADLVRERSVLRQLIHAASEVADAAYNPKGRELGSLVEEAEQKIFQIADQRRRTGSGFKAIRSLLAGAVDRIEELFQKQGHITGMSTGFTDLDEMTSGLQRGDLIVVAGRPAMGKTSFAMNIAENVALDQEKSKMPVAVFSMEMPGEQLAMRMMSSLGRIDQHRVRTGQLQEDEWPRMTSAINILAETKLFIDDTPALTPTELRARCRRLAREYGQLGLVVVDYLQLMQSSGNAENRVNEISEISRSLKALAKEMNVPVIALSQLNRNLEQRTNKRPMPSDLRECVPGDTLVCLADGSRTPIMKLVGTQPEVLAISEDQKIVSAISDQVWAVGKKPVFKLSLSSGRVLRATAKHRIFTGKGWLTLEELKLGDRVALSRKTIEPAQTLEWPDHHLILLGHLVGDGSFLSHQPLRYTTASEENSDAVRNAAESFGCQVNRHAGRGAWHQLVISGNGNRWHPQGVNAWLRQIGIFGQRSHEKHLPDDVFRLSNRQVAILLRHLWATDGSIFTPNSKNTSSRVYFSTSSEQLARDVAALLLRFSIVSRIGLVHQARGRPVWTVDIRSAGQQIHFLDEIGTFGPRVAQADALKSALIGKQANTNVDTLPIEVFEQVKISMQEQGISQRSMASLRGTSYGGSSHFSFAPSRETLANYAGILDNHELQKIAESDLFWDRVVNIKPDGEEEVYDLTVPGPASWLADGIVCHNSGAIEQDADIIIFIYRDEVYNPESPDKGKAEIIIAKQRNGPIGMVPLTFLGQYTRFENFISDPYESYQHSQPSMSENKFNGKGSQMPASFSKEVAFLREK